MKYYYETLDSDGPCLVVAANDTEAMERIKEECGDSLIGVLIVYEEESSNQIRTVWME